MKISINENNEIMSFAKVGEIDNGIEIEESVGYILLESGFKPGKYLYTDGEIIDNPDYIEPEVGETLPPKLPEFPGSDEELRKVFGNLQMSSVQTSRIVYDLSAQVAELTKQNVEMQTKINEMEVK